MCQQAQYTSLLGEVTIHSRSVQEDSILHLSQNAGPCLYFDASPNSNNVTIFCRLLLCSSSSKKNIFSKLKRKYFRKQGAQCKEMVLGRSGSNIYYANACVLSPVFLPSSNTKDDYSKTTKVNSGVCIYREKKINRLQV